MLKRRAGSSRRRATSRISMPQASNLGLKSAERFEDEVFDLVGHGSTAMGEVRESVRRYLSASPWGAGVE